MGEKLIKVDKNGTKYWANNVCRRCGGAGGAEQWRFTGFKCYRCGGSGIDPTPSIYKEYTEEYAKKLAERRRKVQEKKEAERKAKADELNKEFFENNNFSADGKTYVALGDSYSMKDRLKELGFRFKSNVGWMSPVKVDGIETLELSADDIFRRDRCGVFDWKALKKAYFLNGEQITEKAYRENDYTWEDGFSFEFNAKHLIHQANIKRESKSQDESTYVGKVGDKITTEVKLTRTSSWETSFGYRCKTMYMHIMEDSNGNVIVWKTDNGSLMFMPKGEEHYKRVDTDSKFTISGTIKELSEYNGIKQTVLTRCKVNQ